jgi:hypothetical protein
MFWTSICFLWPVCLNWILSVSMMSGLLTNKYSDETYCAIYQTNLCQSLTRTLLTSVMIKEIRSWTCSIPFGHCAATELIVSKASKSLYIPELQEKFYIIERMWLWECQQVWFPWWKNYIGKVPVGVAMEGKKGSWGVCMCAQTHACGGLGEEVCPSDEWACAWTQFYTLIVSPIQF